MFDNKQIPLINNKEVFVNKRQKDLLDQNLKWVCSKEITYATFSDVIPSPTNPFGKFNIDLQAGTFDYYETSPITADNFDINAQIEPKAGWQIEDGSTYKFYYRLKHGTVIKTTNGRVTFDGNRVWFNRRTNPTAVGKNEIQIRFYDENGQVFKLPVSFDMEWIDAGATYNEEIYFTANNMDGTYDLNEVKSNVVKNGFNAGGPGTDVNPNKETYMRNSTSLGLGNTQIHIDTRIAYNESKTAGTALTNADDVKIQEPARKMNGFDLSYENFQSDNGTGAENAEAWFEWGSKGYSLPSPQKVCVQWKTQKWQQEINVIEYESNCNNEDCNYKQVQTTKLLRDVFENQDSSKKYGTWFFKERNLKDLKNTYSFDGNIIVNLQTDYPWIAEGSYRTGLQEIKVYLFSDCCSTCGKDCTKQKGCKYELVVPKKFIPKNCFDKEPPKTWENCLKVERPHWVKKCSETSSNLCNWTPASTNCQVRFNYLNKQQLNEFIVDWYTKNYDLESFIKTHIWDSLNNCGVGSILKTNDKTIYGAINELLTKLALKH